MGTSKSYSASIKGQPQWGNLSSVVTSSCDSGAISPQNLGTILSRYVNVIGGSGKAGRGNSKIGGRAGIRSAKKLGTFFAAFGSSGGNIQAALTAVGLPDLTGKSVDDVINHLLEYCTGPSSTIDDVAAKTAAQKILEEIAGSADTIEEFQESLQTIMDTEGLQDIFIRYFGYYIFEHLSIMFYEKLVVEKGKVECNNLFKQIRDFVFEKLKTINKTNPLGGLDWKGDDADRLVKNIQEDVLKVFEGYEG